MSLPNENPFDGARIYPPPLETLAYLNEYAETGEKYVEVLTKIIKQNDLKDFDDAKLLPSSIELESLI